MSRIPAPAERVKPDAATGINGCLEVSDDEVSIRRGGTLGFLSHGMRGDTTLRLADISAVRISPAGRFLNGYVSIARRLGRDPVGTLVKATDDNMSIVFSRSQQHAFERIAGRIEACSRPQLAPTQGDEAATSSALK